jgi:MOB kinase activator 1
MAEEDMDVGVGIRKGRDLSVLKKPCQSYWSPVKRTERGLDTLPASPPRSGLQTRISPASEVPDYSYKLLPGGGISLTSLKTENHAAPGSGSGYQISRNKDYLADTSLLSFSSNPRTRAPFKPQKTNRGTSSWQLKQYAEATLGSGSLRKAVRLPEGEDKDEWLAVNGRDYTCTRVKGLC